ncbi:DNA-directed RNA polymerase I subunit RPA34 [Ascoidea rubescens DSM 1968]|uniref:RNA polymerase I, subunit RPA34.5 n=1 Tax=Ascoidea rubescens DSM 1968 TaxID=1344418 RepID=A0A1D2VSH7_9ASCO|nr:RNA polymerase I, subunit RPA34.5 [Ascoidea rubescens DSM 1968]ODV64564.1 RNA polymerase I, subunit RPA34.5 [Ascoidea rubescens DSM 1968]
MVASKTLKSQEYIGDSDSELDNNDQYVFHPPTNYVQVKNFNSISPSHLKDKQIWLIKTPKNFSFKTIKKLPVNFGKQASVLDFNDKSYKLKENSFNSTAEPFTSSLKYRILLPASSDNTLKIQSDLEINKFFTISESVPIPEINYDKVIKPRKDVKKIKNINMRNFPSGYGLHDYKESTEFINYDDLVPKNAENQVDYDDASENENENEPYDLDKDIENYINSDIVMADSSIFPENQINFKKDKKDKKDRKIKKEKKEKKDKKDKKSKKEGKVKKEKKIKKENRKIKKELITQ